jgi:signal-transduction protein with cAMP-binding, CBS, and nucleotidyltransferase domain
MDLREALQKEQVTHLDLSGFCQVGAGTTVRQALKQMQTNGQNVCLIFDGRQLCGIITDRDVLRKVVAVPAVWDQPVETVMTADPITIRPEVAAIEALRVMDEKAIRNLPVLDADGTVTGTMTHQAIIHYLAAHYPNQILNLPPRPGQFPSRPEGGD